jgi:hypothetical protein
MWSCVQIVNASLLACADRPFAERQVDLLAFLRWSGKPQKIIAGPGRVTQKKYHAELLRDCECVPRRSGARLGLQRAAEFLAALFRVGVGTAEDQSEPGIISPENISCELLRDCEP